MKIAVLDDFQNVSRQIADWSGLPANCALTVFNDHVADEDKLVERLQSFDIVCVMRERTPLPKRVIDRLPDLKLIVSTGHRNASIDVAAANARGVTVCNTNTPGRATAELAMALLLALFRKLPAQMEEMRKGGWQAELGRDLGGATLGILGLGRLGTQVAKHANSFGMEVIAWSQNLTAERAAEAGAGLVAKEQLFRTADAVTVHLKLSERTIGIVGAEEIALMKPDACLVNTSRAPIVDYDALVAALREERLAGAALDVFDIEPLPADSPLRGVPNLLLTPHIGYSTRDTYAVFYPETVEAVLAFLSGKPIRVVEP
ncbi:MAG: D-2-hydroxyacid dehydrogenase family protein [Hyphomicrobiales bacterium]|nr:D-2-hydroxyacid dehydrogenase family protein [Hyphomicrobiales bacterium]